jgi:hypothetical protein
MLFIIITFANDKMYIPLGLILVNSIIYVFVDFYKSIIPLLATFGISLILLTKGGKNKMQIILGYVFTYLLLVKIILDNQLYIFNIEQLYFYISSIIYLIISFIVLYRVIFFQNKV